MAEDWITTEEAAELANYHPEHVRELAREGKIGARKFGPVWQISRERLLAYVRQQEAKGARRGPKPG
jgi:excisionase family DNA binding protein